MHGKRVDAQASDVIFSAETAAGRQHHGFTRRKGASTRRLPWPWGGAPQAAQEEGMEMDSEI